MNNYFFELLYEDDSHDIEKKAGQRSYNTQYARHGDAKSQNGIPLGTRYAMKSHQNALWHELVIFIWFDVTMSSILCINEGEYIYAWKPEVA